MPPNAGSQVAQNWLTAAHFPSRLKARMMGEGGGGRGVEEDEGDSGRGIMFGASGGEGLRGWVGDYVRRVLASFAFEEATEPRLGIGKRIEWMWG